MNHSELTEKYLQRVILFKAKQEVYSDFCEEEKREKLLKDLVDELGFEEPWWTYRKEIAERAFKIHELLCSDYKLGHVMPRMYADLQEVYIRRAIALDPFQPMYYKEYFSSDAGRSKPDKNLALQYIRLFHPNSAEFQNLLVDLNIRSNEVSFDYLAESVTMPFISELVFLREKAEGQKSSGKESEQLQQLAKQAGLDEKELETIEVDVKQMIRTVQDAMNTLSPNWTDTYKATLAMEKAIDLAPYHEDVLLTGILFYGGFCWRAILGYKDIKDVEGKAELMEYLTRSKKPKREQVFWKAAELFKRSITLRERWVAVVLKNEEKKYASSQSDYDKMVTQFGLDDFGMQYGHFLRVDRKNTVTTSGHLDKEIITFKLLSAHYRSKKNEWPIAIIAGCLTAIGCYLFSHWLFDSWVPFFPAFIPAILVPAAILYVREKTVQYKKLEIDESTDLEGLTY